MLYSILCRLEKRYGEMFVTYALSYITCGYSGISEIELEDALSCSDEVLVEVSCLYILYFLMTV